MTEYQHGFNSGKRHGNHIPGILPTTTLLYKENEKKIEHAKNDPCAAETVKEYWKGYEAGMKSITPPPTAPA